MDLKFLRIKFEKTVVSLALSRFGRIIQELSKNRCIRAECARKCNVTLNKKWRFKWKISISQVNGCKLKCCVKSLTRLTIKHPHWQRIAFIIIDWKHTSLSYPTSPTVSFNARTHKHQFFFSWFGMQISFCARLLVSFLIQSILHYNLQYLPDKVINCSFKIYIKSHKGTGFCHRESTNRQIGSTSHRKPV